EYIWGLHSKRSLKLDGPLQLCITASTLSPARVSSMTLLGCLLMPVGIGVISAIPLQVRNHPCPRLERHNHYALASEKLCSVPPIFELDVAKGMHPRGLGDFFGEE